MNKTLIEWTDYTVNPLRFRPHGSSRTVTMCQKISPGCAKCYAAQFGVRFWPKDSGMAYPGYTAEGIASGDPAEWPEDLRVREMPEVRA